MKYLLNYYLEMKPQISDDDEDNDLRRLATNIKEKNIAGGTCTCLYMFCWYLSTKDKQCK
jgi:hypothetical protein